MFTDISVVPTAEVRTVAMSVYVSVATEISFQVIGHFDRMVYDFLELGEINVKLLLCLIKNHMKPYGGKGDLAPYILNLSTRRRYVITVMV
jgi:hypothetical protein